MLAEGDFFKGGDFEFFQLFMNGRGNFLNNFKMFKPYKTIYNN